MKRHRRRKAQRVAARLYLVASRPSPQVPATITLTRLAPRILDCDNLRGALKAVRDGIADWLGVDDGDPRLTWEYGQEKRVGEPMGVRVEINGE